MAQRRNTRTVTANAVVELIDEVLLLDVTAEAIQLTLPDTSGIDIEGGYRLIFIPITGDITANNVTIIPDPTDGTTISGIGSLVMRTGAILILELMENNVWTVIATSQGQLVPLKNGAAPFAIALDNNHNNIASGEHSLAFGFETLASAYAGVALGYQTRANATNLSMAINWNTEASGNQSFAQGLSTKARGANSVSTGNESEANGANSFSSGWRSKAQGYASTSRGLESEARGQGSYAEGSGSIAGVADGGAPGSGAYSHAQNLYTLANGDASHAGGAGINNGGSPKRVTASGYAAFNHSEADVLDEGVGAAARASAILGGLNNKILLAALRSVVLGGQGLTGSEPDFVYVPNLEIQGGIGRYTVDPTTQPSWGDRSVPDKAYVDSVSIAPWAEDANFSSNIIFTKYQGGTLTPAAEINISLTNGNLRYQVQGKTVLVIFDFIIEVENVSADTGGLSYGITISMDYLPSSIRQNTRSPHFIFIATELPGLGTSEIYQFVTAKPDIGLDFGKSPLSLNVGQHYQIPYSGQLFLELT